MESSRLIPPSQPPEENVNTKSYSARKAAPRMARRPIPTGATCSAAAALEAVAVMLLPDVLVGRDVIVLLGTVRIDVMFDPDPAEVGAEDGAGDDPELEEAEDDGDSELADLDLAWDDSDEAELEVAEDSGLELEPAVEEDNTEEAIPEEVGDTAAELVDEEMANWPE
jgi:hypothetical protein